MTKTGELAAISKPRKKPATAAQRRLRELDPDTAKLFDEWEGEMHASLALCDAALNHEYDLALNDNPAPPILDEEEKLAFELGRFHLAADPFLEVAEKLREDRDAAYMVLGRVEHVIAQRTLEALQLTPQAALPPPPPRDDDWGDPTEDYRFLRADPDDQLEIGENGLPVGTPEWDDPEGALMTTYQPPKRRSKWGLPGYPRRWIAGAIAWCSLPLIAAAIIARWSW